jgi:hypothetical protein
VLLSAGQIPSGAGAPVFGFELSHAPVNQPAALFFGHSITSWMGVPLPWMPAPVTMPGCSVYVAPEYLLTATTNQFGRAFFPLPVPPGFSGFFLHFQAYVLNPGATVMPGALTGALQVLVL